MFLNISALRILFLYLPAYLFRKASSRLGFTLNTQEAEIGVRLSIFLSLLNSSELSFKYDAIAIIFSVLQSDMISRISTSGIPVWCCLENSFL